MSTCNTKLQEAGMSYPRTCAVCKLGPCHYRSSSKDVTQNLICPFCGEDSFDAVGMKMHIVRGHCAPFEAIEVAA